MSGAYPGSAPPSYGGYQQAGGYPGSGVPPQQQQQQQPGGYPGGGYQQQQQRPAAPPQQGGYMGYTPQPPQVDPNIASWFRAVDTDNSGQIDANELKRALVNGNWSNFSEEACKMMIKMFDRDRTNTINIYEFADLYRYINQWKAIFESIDRDRSGFIEHNELMSAFQQMGYRFTPTFVQNLLAKYDPKTRKLTLDNFIVVSIEIKRLTDSFRTRDREMRGQVTFAYEDFMGVALGCHH